MDERFSGGTISPSIDMQKLNGAFSVPRASSLYPDLLQLQPSLFCIYRQLVRINIDKPSGSDSLSTLIHLSTLFTDVFNLCIDMEKMPDFWQSAQITFIPKKESQTFRPVACTSHLLNILKNLFLHKL